MGLVILTKYKRENKQTLKKNPESYRVLEVKIYYILNNNSTPLSKHFALNKTISVLSCLPFSQTFMIVGSMSIECCPVLTPTWNEFKNFSNYVEKVDKLYKSRYGMVKVIPPPEWKPASSAYAAKLKGLMINGPIEQNIFGKGGVYECLHIQKKSLPLSQYKTKMGIFDKITDGLSSQEVEEMFWKSIVFSPPLYGADLLSTLMDQKAGPWNLSDLDSLLKFAVKSNVKGVTTPYCYVGSWKTLFCWHKQDLDLSAINYLHEGKSKFWYSIPVEQSSILEKEAKNYFPEHFSRCSEHLRHKTTLLNPYNLKKKYPELNISKIQHKPGQFMLVLGGSYHCGFNFGFNIAEAVNYGTKSWLQKLPNSHPCNCSKNSVRASYREILNNLLDSPYSSTKQLLEFQNFVEREQEKQLQSQMKETEIKAVKLQFSKKIKKEKKIKNLKLKGENYEIDNWAACDKCNQWRKINFKIREGGSFRCRDIGKQCYLKEKISKEYITL